VKPIRVGTTVERPVAEVYEYLDVLANHEAFTDHMLVDWTPSGPAAGVGATVRLRPKMPGPAAWSDMRSRPRGSSSAA